jgi:DNA repair exonuclease SbcCD ATPase subunit/predicted phosphodiesterase
MTSLPLPSSGVVKEIIHISDLHIRTGDKSQCRYDEYMTVFNNTILSINNILTDSTVIVITGDIFHNKNRLESSGIILFNTFINNLSKLAPVYIISGNHDYRQDQVDTPDLIEALLHDRVIENVFYMENTGHYIAGDIGFGLVSIRDTLKAGDTSGQIDELPDFPDSTDFSDSIKTKIALFHGTINGCTLQNYTKSPSGYPIEWFEGYDIALLGDVHLQQIHNINEDGTWQKNSMQWGYPGSLIQQNFGESIFDHGALVWDLQEQKVEVLNIQNQCGYMTLKETEDGWFVSYKKKWVHINDIIGNDMCPNEFIIRINTEDGIYNEQSLANILGSPHNIKFNIVNVYGFMDEYSMPSTTDDISTNDIASSNNPTSWIEYLEKNISSEISNNFNWKQWITNPDTMMIPIDIMPSSLHDKVKSRNEDIMNGIHNLQNDLDRSITIKKRLSLNYMHWQWLLCFKDDCYMNFDDLNSKVCTINAKNGYGKSSFFEVICIALFGEPITSRYNKDTSSSIICLQKPKDGIPEVILNFKLNDKMYSIRRSFEIQKIDKVEIKRINYKDVDLSDLSVPEKPIIIHSGKTAVDSWVKDNIGDISSFLLSGMITQNCDNDFFNMKSEDQTNILEKYLNLNSINLLNDLLKTTVFNYRHICNSIDDVNKWARDNNVYVSQEDYDNSLKVYTTLTDKIKILEEEYETIPERWHNISKEDIVLEDDVIQDKIQSITDNINNITVLKEYDVLQREIGILTDKLKDIPDVSQLKYYTEADLETITTKLQKYLERKELLMKDMPFKPVKSLEEFEEWNIQYNEWIEHICKIYGSVENLLKSVKDNAVQKPTIDEDTLKSQKTMFNSEISNVTDWEKWVDNIEGLNEYIDNILSKKNHIEDNKIGLEDELKSVKDKFSICSQKLRTHLRNPIVKPTETEEDYSIFEETFKEYEKDIPQVKKRLIKCNNIIDSIKSIDTELVVIKNDILRNKKDIKVITSAEHPYNDDCWACKQQAWRIHLVNLENSTKELKEQYISLEQKRIELLGKKELDTLIDLSKDYEEYISDWNEMCDSKKEWDKIKLQWSQYKPYKKTLVLLEIEENELKDKLVDVEIALADIYIQEKHKNKDYEVSVYCRDNLPRWKCTLEMINTQEKLWVDYNASLSFMEDVSTTHKYLDEEKEWQIITNQYNLYDEWEQKIELVNDKCTKLALISDEIKGYLYSIRLSEVQKELVDYNTKIKLTNECNYWKTIQEVKYDYIRKLDFKTKLDTLKKEEKLASSQYHTDKMLYEKSQKLEIEEVDNKKIKNNLMNIRNALEHIQGKLSGFRKWLYDVKVMPRLLTETNRIISSVTNSTDLKLEVDVDASKPKTSLSWYIRHGVNRPYIEKASGFQRWMFGLAFRISMAFLGASAVSCSQMFIDEGFVACDTEHLSRVPDFLEDLLKKYSTVVLVSHLEEIKNCASIKVPITRENDLSTIQFGKQMKVKIERKKRGRPAKAK